ncbi:hypothetical protein ACTWPT_44615 [Nonomuraea sp. 3N208]|uniref:hypothetical protein n=1 Tax=Nonomuraea sp. 3N208 TaxID=3457421 RepID=UPI003FD12429
MSYWLREVVEPNLAPATAATYETFCRLYIGPALGKKQLDKLELISARCRSAVPCQLDRARSRR